MEFDEDKAVNYILEHTGLSSYDEDQILNVIDIIWDYYEDNGYLDLDLNDDAGDADPEKLIAHVEKMLARDKGNAIAREDVAPIVRAELDYEATLD